MKIEELEKMCNKCKNKENVEDCITCTMLDNNCSGYEEK